MLEMARHVTSGVELNLDARADSRELQGRVVREEELGAGDPECEGKFAKSSQFSAAGLDRLRGGDRSAGQRCRDQPRESNCGRPAHKRAQRAAHPANVPGSAERPYSFQIQQNADRAEQVEFDALLELVQTNLKPSIVS